MGVRIYQTLPETQKALYDICSNWDKNSEDYQTFAAAMIYLEEYAQFLEFIRRKDCTETFGEFMILNTLRNTADNG